MSRDELQTRKAPRSRTITRSVLGLLLAALILWWMITRVETAVFLAALRSANLLLLMLAAPALAGLIGLKAKRWGVAMSSGVEGRPRRHLLHAMAIGVAVNLILPARMGDLARVGVFCRSNAVPVTLAFASAWSVQLFDLATLAFVLLGLVAWGGNRGLVSPTILLAVLAAVGVLLMVVLVHALRPGILARAIRLLPTSIQARVSRIVTNIGSGVRFLRQPRVLLHTLGLTVGIWLLEATVLGLGLKAFDLPANPETVLLLLASLSLSFAVPLTPGNLGTFQLVCVLVLALFGVDEAEALAFGLGYQLAVELFYLLLGALAALRLSRHRSATYLPP